MNKDFQDDPSLQYRVSRFIATLGGIGCIPYAPGTFGSAAGLLLLLLCPLRDSVLLVTIFCLFFLGVAASGRAESGMGKDSGQIVIDELCGYFLSCLFLPRAWGYLVAAFVLFRAFDILKPFPIGQAENTLSGGLGIMTDDILAGLYANLCLQVWYRVFAL